MNTNQIHNIFYFLGVMLVDNKIINTSPDYLEEKSLSFFGKLGKDEFVSDIKNRYYTQLTEKVSINDDFWNKYCKIWHVDDKNYHIMNILNFILSTNINNHKNVIQNFEKYIGDVDIISDSDLSYKLHPKLLDFMNRSINFNSRYLKLITINNINKNKK